MNRATRVIVASLGALLGLSGMNHGLFEALQGNTPTPGSLIYAIPVGNTWSHWPQGSEGAFTLVHNFLATGLLAMLLGLTIVIWSVGLAHKPYGPLGLFGLFIALVLVGGGIGQIPFFVLVCALATRINRPLTGWRARLPAGLRQRLAGLWPGALGTTIVLFIIALEIAVLGYVPGVTDPTRLLTINWSVIGAGLVALLFTFAAGLAHDSEPAAPNLP